MTDAPERIWLDPHSYNGAVGFAHPEKHKKDGWPGYHRSDLCASGQVRALEWDEYAPGCFFGKSECGDYSVAPSASAFHEGEIRLSDVEGNFSYFASPEAAKAAAQADYESRILAALTPAPQPEGATPSVKDPEWLTHCCICKRVVDTREADAGGDPHGCQLDDGHWTCSSDCWGEATGSTAATPNAQEAVPVAWRYRYVDPVSGEPIWRYSNNLWNGQRPSESQPLYAHPPQPSETVAEVAIAALVECIEDMEAAGLNSPARAHAALRALKGEV